MENGVLELFKPKKNQVRLFVDGAFVFVSKEIYIKWLKKHRESKGVEKKEMSCEVEGCNNQAKWIVEFSSFNDPIQRITIQAGIVKMCDEHHQFSLNCGNYKNSKKI